MLDADPDGVWRCATHSVRRDLIAEQRELRRKRAKARRAQLAAKRGKGPRGPAPYAHELEEGSEQVEAADQELRGGMCTAEWLTEGRDLGSPKGRIAYLDRVAEALSHGWIEPREAAEHRAIVNVATRQGNVSDADTGVQVSFTVVNNRTEAEAVVAAAADTDGLDAIQ